MFFPQRYLGEVKGKKTRLEFELALPVPFPTKITAKYTSFSNWCGFSYREQAVLDRVKVTDKRRDVQKNNLNFQFYSNFTYLLIFF